MRVKTLIPNPETISLAAAAIRRGDVIGLPTETVYGLAGDIRNSAALQKIFEVKGRPASDPLIVHVNIKLADPLRELEDLQLIDGCHLSGVNQSRVNALLRTFWPGPLTLILPKHPGLSKLITSGLNTVAIRMPQHPVALALIHESGTPLAAPSANRFGRISPTSAAAVAQELGDKIDFILDGGPSAIGLESTVVALNGTDSVFEILRPGGTSKEALESVLGTPVQVRKQQLERPSHAIQGPQTGLNLELEPEASLLSPGLLESHYAPEKPLYILNRPAAEMSPERIENLIAALKADGQEKGKIGLLLISGDPVKTASDFGRKIGCEVIGYSLSESGNASLEDAARQLYSSMRALDAMNIAAIMVEPVSDLTGFGLAISDRLRRASARTRNVLLA